MTYVIYAESEIPPVPPSYVLTGVDWELATDKLFVSKLFSVFNDTKNLHSITRLVSVPGPYFVRARFRFGNKITDWSLQNSSCEVQ